LKKIDIESLLLEQKNLTRDYPEKLEDNRRKAILSSLPIFSYTSAIPSYHPLKAKIFKSLTKSFVGKSISVVLIGSAVVGSLFFWDEIFPVVTPTPTQTVQVTASISPSAITTASPTITLTSSLTPTPSGKHLGQTPTPPGQRKTTP
jgi:hypothetical protein